MKRIILPLFVLFLGAGTMQAQSQSDFMRRYEKVVKQIESIDSDNYKPAQLDSIEARYDRLTDEVDKYKDNMTDDQLQTYYKLKARYQKKRTILATKRGAKRAIGWVKGVIGKD